MSNTTILCLGHGGAFAGVNPGNSSFLVDHNGKKILLDCGSMVPEQMKQYGIDPGELDTVVISHLHGDHVGGLERILYHRKFISKAPPLKIVMAPATMNQWGDAIYRMGLRFADPSYIEYETFHGTSDRGDWKVETTQVDHTGVDGNELAYLNCHSFLFTFGEKKLFFSGDKVWTDGDKQVEDMMDSADLILHEIEIFENPSGVHAHWKDIPEKYRNVKARWHHHGADDSTRMAFEERGFILAKQGDQYIL